jgi:hypothetical protein
MVRVRAREEDERERIEQMLEALRLAGNAGLAKVG